MHQDPKERFKAQNKIHFFTNGLLENGLTDFSVHYSQGLVDSITAELKAGKSEVACDAGQLVKFSKDKDGIIKREVLTKKWTDWVDYWAVDFHYESRKEIINVDWLRGVQTAPCRMNFRTDHSERTPSGYSTSRSSMG